MQYQHPVRGQALEVEAQRLARQQMDRDRVRAVGIEDHQVVALARGGERETRVAEDHAHLGRALVQVAKQLGIGGDVLHRGVDLVVGPALAGVRVRGERSSSQAGHCDTAASGRVAECPEHVPDRAAAHVVTERLAAFERDDALHAVHGGTVQELKDLAGVVLHHPVNPEEAPLRVNGPAPLHLPSIRSADSSIQPASAQI